ncbi:MAG: S41 family peptidase [Chitinophagales bacterium]|nr:S41 family peptidase [Chitinophagales bacterium]
MKKYILILLLFLVLTTRANDDNNRYFEIAKNLEIFTTLYKELNYNYVDEIDPNKIMTDGINKMLEGLDPFTNYITGADIDEYRLQTTGKYGGIGARIGRQDGLVMITEPYEGYPAQKAGLQAGDKIIEIDGKSCKDYSPDEVSELLKGEPNTPLSLKVIKAVTNKEASYTFNRAEIKIKNVPYFGMLNNNIGYMKLESFTENAGKEVQDALKDLKAQGAKGIVLDLRGNGGGLLNEAITICNTFVNKGINIVSTKGKVTDYNVDYPTLADPVDVNIPLVILTDGGSASASEIVSGSMQDLDRGVIIGQNTYGKGLVQITKPIAYKSQLKVTISKYYIPSGRCIQRIDYSHRDDDGNANAVPDSLRKSFKTKNGRIVKDGAGIEPDIKMESHQWGIITATLFRDYFIFDYANKYFVEHPTLRDGNKFKLTDAEYDDFVNALKGKDYDYTTYSEDALAELKKDVQKDSVSASVMSLINDLEQKIKHDKEQDIYKYKNEIKQLLQQEIVSRYNYEAGRIENALQSDEEVKKAVDILSNTGEYHKILGINN